ncbi:molybdate ABC transporter substrate-binding protein [Marivivens donghaensis]|uniref:Molybdate ABC transporter substrate-binding protein n=1 Tax=Marivivens donghaensis TaxID=1699413 RepID=A0ABX0VU24_9RHOB|nr:molybdate ABC transporter substrate-binding protein [Marivivens donghaensis]NIY71310.1 molybdate ABC transporter substrate-binding protein [Marivivens donghaensis]
MKSAVLAAVMALSAGQASADEVIVFAAASLKTALDEIASDYKAETGETVLISYAGSSKLAQQIIQGAPADVFISASTQWMDAVEAEGLLTKGSRTDLLGNSLVLVGFEDAMFDIAGLPEHLGNERLAMALVNSVPAGQYGKEALTSLSLWGTLAPSVAQADNVRAALALVATGEAPFGIVYASDAVAEPSVHVIATFAEDTHAPIIYPAALTTEASDTAFLDYLSTPQAADVFEAQGFTVMQGKE